jgi:formylglycine-generating enzyme required for sulfatase activity
MGPTSQISTGTVILESEPNPLTQGNPPAIPTDGLKTTRLPVEGGPKSPDESQGEQINPQPQIISEPQPRKRRWLAYAAAALVLIAALLIYTLMPGRTDYRIVVRDAPAGSEVFLNGEKRGEVGSGGELELSGLEPGKAYELTVRREGFMELKQVFTGEGGEEARISAEPVMIPLPREIDLKGEMVLIPASDFIMGSDNSESDERPARTIPASQVPDFYIDKFEVTNRQYKEFCDATGHDYPAETPSSKAYFNNNPDSPVMGVSWYDADAYSRWAGKRLPTEEEWEKAASWDPVAGRKRKYPWGDEPNTSRANFTGQPMAVGRYPSGVSAYGVHDMAGNLAEWVQAYYKPYPGNQTPNPDYGTKFYVIRGGTYRGPIKDATTTYRDYRPPDERERLISPNRGRKTSIGFRCAISVSDQSFQELLRSKRP